MIAAALALMAVPAAAGAILIQAPACGCATEEEAQLLDLGEDDEDPPTEASSNAPSDELKQKLKDFEQKYAKNDLNSLPSAPSASKSPAPQTSSPLPSKPNKALTPAEVTRREQFQKNIDELLRQEEQLRQEFAHHIHEAENSYPTKPDPRVADIVKSPVDKPILNKTDESITNPPTPPTIKETPVKAPSVSEVTKSPVPKSAEDLMREFEEQWKKEMEGDKPASKNDASPAPIPVAEGPKRTPAPAPVKTKFDDYLPEPRWSPELLDAKPFSLEPPSRSQNRDADELPPRLLEEFSKSSPPMSTARAPTSASSVPPANKPQTNSIPTQAVAEVAPKQVRSPIVQAQQAPVRAPSPLPASPTAASPQQTLKPTNSTGSLLDDQTINTANGSILPRTNSAYQKRLEFLKEQRLKEQHQLQVKEENEGYYARKYHLTGAGKSPVGSSNSLNPNGSSPNGNERSKSPVPEPSQAVSSNTRGTPSNGAVVRPTPTSASASATLSARDRQKKALSELRKVEDNQRFMAKSMIQEELHKALEELHKSDTLFPKSPLTQLPSDEDVKRIDEMQLNILQEVQRIEREDELRRESRRKQIERQEAEETDRRRSMDRDLEQKEQILEKLREKAAYPYPRGHRNGSSGSLGSMGSMSADGTSTEAATPVISPEVGSTPGSGRPSLNGQQAPAPARSSNQPANPNQTSYESRLEERLRQAEKERSKQQEQLRKEAENDPTSLSAQLLNLANLPSEFQSTFGDLAKTLEEYQSASIVAEEEKTVKDRYHLEETSEESSRFHSEISSPNGGGTPAVRNQQYERTSAHKKEELREHQEESVSTIKMNSSQAAGTRQPMIAQPSLIPSTPAPRAPSPKNGAAPATASLPPPPLPATPSPNKDANRASLPRATPASNAAVAAAGLESPSQQPDDVVLASREELAARLDSYLRHQPKYSSALPMKFKMSISKLATDCEKLRVRYNSQVGDKGPKIANLHNFVLKHPRFSISGAGQMVGVNSLTPYQGPEGRRLFGQFRCSKCVRYWMEAGTNKSDSLEWANSFSYKDCHQLCPQCNVVVYPYAQRDLTAAEQADAHAISTHDSARCSRCEQLRRPCYEA